jgi:hypothetical protein
MKNIIEDQLIKGFGNIEQFQWKLVFASKKKKSTPLLFTFTLKICFFRLAISGT